jgi:hypothetical protein
MSGRPAQIRQRELKQTIFAAQKAGAREVRVKLPEGAEIIIPLAPADKPDAQDANEWAVDDAHKA